MSSGREANGWNETVCVQCSTQFQTLEKDLLVKQNPGETIKLTQLAKKEKLVAKIESISSSGLLAVRFNTVMKTSFQDSRATFNLTSIDPDILDIHV